MYPKYLKIGTFLDIAEEKNIAEKFYLEFLKHDKGRYYKVYQNLGYLYLKTNQYKKAKYCFEQILKHDKKNKAAIKNLNYLRSKI